MIPRERFEGGLLGLALGDALGAPYEGGLIARALWRLLGTTPAGEMRWTDDTQMALDLAESLAAQGRVDPDDIARRFAASYRWSRGYGPGTAKLLKRIRAGQGWEEAGKAVQPRGSFGNGAAMRAPVLGLFLAGRLSELGSATRLTARITHGHPLGQEGAVLIATATAHAALGRSPAEILEAVVAAATEPPFVERLQQVQGWVDEGIEPTPREVVQALGHGITALESCTTALYAALRFWKAPFEALHRFVVALGGDVDTIGAMAGGIWGAGHGIEALPQGALERLEQRRRLMAAAQALHVRTLAG